MRRDEDYGLNEDGSKSEYCHNCYKDGKFTNPDLTIEQEIEKVINMAISQLGMDEEAAKKLAFKIIPTLKRWNKRF